MARLTSLLVGFQLAFALALFAQGQTSSHNPSGLIQSAIEHRWRDESRADEFTYIELWHNRNINNLGQVIVDESARFESISLDGKTYLRMIEKNGVPLKGQDAEMEEQSYNSSITTGNGKELQERIADIVSRSVGLGLNLDLLPGYFHTVTVGLDAVNGRDAFEFLCTPRTDIKPKEKADRKGTQFKVRVWIDARDLRFTRVKAELLKDHNHMLSGTIATINWAPEDGIWLPLEMSIQGHAKEGKTVIRFQTEYRYSNYRKFHSDSRVVGTPTPVAPGVSPNVKLSPN
jgi:hypothetical protein